MACDRSQFTFLGHHVTQDRDMAIVDINAIESQNCSKFVAEGLARGFRPEYIFDL